MPNPFVNTQERQKRSVQAVNLGLGANILLAGLKSAVGILGHSPALLAEGINSTSDVAYYIVVSIFMRLARKPADEEHPYGHSQLESIAALVVGAFVIATAIAIFWDAMNKLYDLYSGNGQYTGSQVIALYIALFTVGMKIFLLNFTRRIGRLTDNPAVIALAYDHRNDIFSASGAAVGIFLSQFGLTWADPLAGALVALVILRTGVEIVRQSSVELMDAVPSQALANTVNDLLGRIETIEKVEAVHAHRFGPYLVINLTIGVDGNMSVFDGDNIATQAEMLLYENIPFLGQVHVHYHPVCEPREKEPRRLMTLE